MSKVLLQIIHHHLNPIIERELPAVQAGFRLGHGTCDHFKLWKDMQELGVADHLIRLIGSFYDAKKMQYLSQNKQSREARLHFVHCKFNLYAEVI